MNDFCLGVFHVDLVSFLFCFERQEGSKEKEKNGRMEK